MTHLEIKYHYDAPIERVWELGSDFKRYPEWNVTYTEVTDITGPSDKVGTKVHSIMRLLGRKMEGWGEIVEVDRPRLLKMTGTSAEGGKLTFVNRATPAGTGTDFTCEVDYELPAGLFGQIANKLFIEKAVERDLRHSIENFKALVELKEPALV